MNSINFETLPIQGEFEMLPYERFILYKWITEIIKPIVAVEFGTGHGGSTYYITKALEQTGGFLHTCDPERSPLQEIFNLNKNFKYYSITSDKLINILIENNINIDYLFFDGPEDPMIALTDLIKLENYIKPGCYFSMHDWEIEKRGFDGAISTKALHIRPYIENSSRWKLIHQLSGLEKNSKDNDGYDSVGLCLYQFIG